jgi:hypothetical protein
MAAADAVGGIAVLPGVHRGRGHAQDWNDEVAAVGIVEVRVKFQRVLAVAEKPSQNRKRC